MGFLHSLSVQSRLISLIDASEAGLLRGRRLEPLREVDQRFAVELMAHQLHAGSPALEADDGERAAIVAPLFCEGVALATALDLAKLRASGQRSAWPAAHSLTLTWTVMSSVA